MAVDPWALLAWMVEREQNEPGSPTLWGTQFLQQAEQLATEERVAWDAIANAAVHLKRLGYIAWTYKPVQNVDPPEPPLQFINGSFLQRVHDIHVTDRGHTAVVSRQKVDPGTQINIINSTVGQLALGDIQNIDIFVLLDAMERSLDQIHASPEDKETARTTLERMRDAAGNVANSAASSVLAAALRQALGLP